ncbi:MAG TPA: hypothetical protein VJ011_12645, partial [Steroidobacteraceae bacterium]|nr:hypothetical protein [Steroidobacteraceae bacterium]
MKLGALHAGHTESGIPASFEPYVQLIRALLPRVSTIALFDAGGGLEWSSDAATGADLLNLVE